MGVFRPVTGTLKGSFEMTVALGQRAEVFRVASVAWLEVAQVLLPVLALHQPRRELEQVGA